MAEISVIVPVYKVEPYLHRCVDSILAQTFSDFELILVDDGSPDNCGAICDEYVAKDDRIHAIHQENRGISAARNIGLDYAFENSNSRWVSFVDSDDWVHPQYLEILLQAAIDSGKAISMCMFAVTETESRFEKEKMALKITSPTEAYASVQPYIAPNAWGRLYDKACFTAIRYPCGRIHEDMATTYKLLYAQDAIAIAENVLYFYYNRADSIIRRKWNKEDFDWFKACEEQFPFLEAQGDFFVLNQLRKEYIRKIHSDFLRIQESEYSNKERQMYALCLRRKMRKALKIHGKQISITVERVPWYYEMAYPKLMPIYWIFKAQLDKLKRK